MELFRAAGYRAVTPVAPQFAPDGRFPTLPFPNPEEPGALDLAIETAEQHACDLVIANDPDADRLGVAVRSRGAWRILRGDEIGWLLASSLLDEMSASDDVVATTIVSSSMLEAMARDAHVRFVTTLTGFKWIARAAGDGVLRFGYEEALGFAVDPAVADKDGMSAALAICQLADDLSRSGATLLDRLDEIETRFGVHAGGQLSLRADGPGGALAIASALERLRSAPPSILGHLPVSAFVDLAQGWHGLAPTDGVRIELRDAGRVIVRPSGTEAKLKVYIEITAQPDDTHSLAEQRTICGALLNAVRDELAELLRL